MASDDVDQVRAEIQQTRQRLGDTVEQLVAKMDVKSRARAKAAELAGQVTGQAKSAAPAPVRRALEGGTSTARKQPVAPELAAAGVLGTTSMLLLLIFLRRKR